MSSRAKKVLILAIVVLSVLAYFYFGLGQYLTLDRLQAQREALNAYSDSHRLAAITVYMLVYIATTALSIPGATILTLAGGAVFGLVTGIILVSFASTIGATLAFLGTRYFFRDSAERRFGGRLEQINRNLLRDGAYYLFTLRLLPVVPFFLVNILMGLTKIPLLTFAFVSQIGMLPATIVYVNAGTRLAELNSLAGILSAKLLLSFAAIGLLPLLARLFFGAKNLKKFKKPKHFDYNIVAIGAGSAGLMTAYIATTLKAKVALIEKNKMGGDCLNTGCVPSKAIIRAAKVASLVRGAQEFGIESSGEKVNFAKTMEYVQSVIQKIAPHDSRERYTKLGVECISGAARIKSPYEVEVGGRILKTKNIVIATGARPFVPPIPGLQEANPLTSDNVWDLQELPERLLVLGGGAIGCELAQSFARLGSKVTLVERNDRILSKEDPDVSELIQDVFRREGISVVTNHQIERIELGLAVCRNHGKEARLSFDKILLALGRRANVSGFGLEELGVELTDRGMIATDEFLRTTNYPNIYVCGDVAGPYQFTHTASHQAWFAAVNALFSPFARFRADYRVIPWCTFTDPEVAHVGLSETEARSKAIPHKITKYDIQELDRAITENEARGFVKILTPAKGDKILGATIVGPHAGDLLAEFVLAMKHGIGLNKILGTIHSYPTLAEANKYAAGVWKKETAPQTALRFLEKFHSWRR